MPRPKIITHRRGGKLGILLRILVVIAAVGIFLEWRPLGEHVPSASAITASAVQIASDAVANNGILNSILTTTKAEGSGSDQSSGGGGAGTDSIDYHEDSGGTDKEEEKDYDNSSKGDDNVDNEDYEDYNSKFSRDEKSSRSGGGNDDDDDYSSPSSSSSSSKLSGSINEFTEDEERDRSIEKDAARTAAKAKAASSAFPKVNGPFFICPDGRIGLHVIHMPLLLGQTMEKGATGVFLAGRMIMLRDFALPSLARQSNKNFVVYVSYDPNQDSAFTKAAQEALKTQIQGNTSDNSAFVYVADNPKYFTNKPDKMLAFPRVANVLVENQIVSRKDVKSVTLYLTSKIDSDDAVHQDAVRYIQQEACARVGPEESERVLSVRIGPKLAWFPHANTTYGVLAKLSEDIELDQREVLKRQMISKPHLTSVAIDVSLMLCQSPLNCYTTIGEGDPVSVFNDLATAEDCPYEFHSDKNILDLEIQGAVAGALFSRPPKFGSAADSPPLGVEFTIDSLKLDGYSPIPFDLNAITGCGIVPGEISATNLLLASVYAEAPYVAGLSSSDAQGWGAVGGMVAAPSPPLQEADSGSGNSGDNSQQGDGMDEEETAMLDAGSMDDEAGDQEDGGEQSENSDYDTERVS
ncbi:hypothetical protein Ndes2526B_g00856 [Nannochloris sp. 'desiccata']